MIHGSVYMVPQLFHFASKMSSDFTSCKAIPVQVPTLNAAALAKQTSAPSCSPLAASQISFTVLELPMVLFHCVVLYLSRL